MSDIESFEALQLLETRIANRLQAYPLDDLLWGLRQHADRLPPVVVAGIAAFAVRFCRAPERETIPLTWQQLERIAEQAHRYLLTDPIVFDQGLREEFYGSNPVFMILRLAANQFPLQVNRFVVHARSLLLFDEIPRAIRGRSGVPGFDFHKAFQDACGVGVADFVRVGFALSGIATARIGFSITDLERARRQGVRLPPPAAVLRAVDQFAGAPGRMREVYQSHRVPDRRFGMYDLNPLHIYPLVRPWGDEPLTTEHGGRMIAPLPDLILARYSLGIYHQMLRVHGKEFTPYFGRVFEEYCGILLRAAVGKHVVHSEKVLRRTYPESRGPVPDYVIVEGRTAILIECKATRFSRAAQTIADESSINASLKQTLKGLRQLSRFGHELQAGAPGLEAFRDCIAVLPVLITLENLSGINGEFFRDHVDALLRERGVTGLPWRTVSMEELELVQPHVAGGIPLSEAVSKSADGPTMAEYEARTGRTNSDSFLAAYATKVSESLGLRESRSRGHRGRRR